MLLFLFEQLWAGAPSDAPGTLAGPIPRLYFLGVGVRISPGREGVPCDPSSLHTADEVVIHLRGGKTVRFKQGQYEEPLLWRLTSLPC